MGKTRVSGYTKSNGTHVKAYTRSSPSSNLVHVSGYTNSNGTHVDGYTRSKPHFTEHNSSLFGNIRYSSTHNNTLNDIQNNIIDETCESLNILMLFDGYKSIKYVLAIYKGDELILKKQKLMILWGKKHNDVEFNYI